MIIYQKWITRSDLQKNPDMFYLFGDNNARKGYGGQAKEMRGEPNAIGIRTKWLPSNDPLSFFYDDQLVEKDTAGMIIDDFLEAISIIKEGGVVVIPSDGLGTGLSRLPEVAPKTHKLVTDMVDYLTTVDKITGGYRRCGGASL